MDEKLDWSLIQDLRKTYHRHSERRQEQGVQKLDNYWCSQEQIDAYDRTLATRIGWKWNAVLKELQGKVALKKDLHVLDFACGSGIASRRFLHFFADFIDIVSLYDRSPLARSYAESKLKQQDFSKRPHIQSLGSLDQRSAGFHVVLLSHVVNELSPADLKPIENMISKADLVVWVEPGSYQESRDLMSFRQAILNKFEIIGPCPHQQTCGLSLPDRETDWCHFFAPSPPEVFHTKFWAEASKQIGFDKRSLPLSYFSMRRLDSEMVKRSDHDSHCSEERLIGRPRLSRSHLRYLSCGKGGISEKTLNKRDDKTLFKKLSTTAFDYDLD